MRKLVDFSYYDIKGSLLYRLPWLESQRAISPTLAAGEASNYNCCHHQSFPAALGHVVQYDKSESMYLNPSSRIIISALLPLSTTDIYRRYISRTFWREEKKYRQSWKIGKLGGNCEKHSR